jgi:ABC-type Na+ transport system ATPase subunit NatA
MTTVLVGASAALGLLHSLVTMEPSFHNTAWLNVMSVFPISAWQMHMMSAYWNAIDAAPPPSWKRMDNDLQVGTRRTMVSLAVDFVAYATLYVILTVDWPRALRCAVATKATLGQGERLIAVDGLRKVYRGLHGRTVALKGVDFEIEKGEIVVMIGLNGAGKSTLLDCLSGVVVPTEGRLTIGDSAATSRFETIWPFLGICFQENVLIPELTAEEHFELFGALHGIPQAELREGVALALLGRPALAILDEPTAGLDVQTRRQVWKAILSLDSTATIATSHSVEDADSINARLLVVADGRI